MTPNGYHIRCIPTHDTTTGEQFLIVQHTRENEHQPCFQLTFDSEDIAAYVDMLVDSISAMGPTFAAPTRQALNAEKPPPP